VGAALGAEATQFTASASQSAMNSSPLGQSANAPGEFAQASGAVTLGVNLLTNPGAESGPVSNNGFDLVASIPGWTRFGNVNVIKYGTTSGLFPSLTDPGPPSRGAALFCGGPFNKVDSLEQSVDLSTLAAVVDSGVVNFALSGYLGGYRTLDDHVSISVRFLDATQTLVGVASIGPVLAADRGDTTALVLRTQTGVVPPLARQAMVTMTFSSTIGLYVLGFADEVSLTLSHQPTGSTAAVSWPQTGGGLRMVIAPNPVPVATEIAFTLPTDGSARVEVLDVGGRRVSVLADGAAGAGAHSLRWSMRDGGSGAGVYFVRLTTPTGTLVRRMVVLGR
jgi:hypothetical protein